jgi:hypothetical protein
VLGSWAGLTRVGHGPGQRAVPKMLSYTGSANPKFQTEVGMHCVVNSRGCPTSAVPSVPSSPTPDRTAGQQRQVLLHLQELVACTEVAPESSCSRVCTFSSHWMLCVASATDSSGVATHVGGQGQTRAFYFFFVSFFYLFLSFFSISFSFSISVFVSFSCCFFIWCFLLFIYFYFYFNFLFLVSFIFFLLVNICFIFNDFFH